MRFGFMQPALRVFGGTRRILEMSNRLVDRGHEVFLYHGAGTAPDWMPCRAKVLPTARHLEREHDVVLFNFPKQLDAARAARSSVRIFYILELYRTRVLCGWRRLHLLRSRYAPERRLRRCLLGPFALASNATWMKTWVETHLRRPCELLIGGVNTELFAPPPDACRDERRILITGDPRPHKGTADVRAALDIVRRSLPHIRVETYHGKGLPQSRMAAVYAGAQIFVDGQHHAGWNNPVIEAMACGTPVVCTDIGGVQDFAWHEQTALLVPPRDPPSMAAAIQRLLADADLRTRLREAAMARARSFDWDAAIDRFVEFCERSLAS